MGVRFRRQRPIGPYIVDFYCPEYGLVVEVDGQQHTHPSQVASDEERTAYLVGRGLRVLRFSNDQVLGQPDSVLRGIAEAVSPSPIPLPARERAAKTPRKPGGYSD
jgi:very-short-patch-repair endonuclease